MRYKWKILPEARNGVLAGHGSVVVIELQTNARMVHGLDQGRCCGNRVRQISGDVDIVDGLNEHGYSGIARKWRNLIEIRNDSCLMLLVSDPLRNDADLRVQLGCSKA